MPYLKRPTKHCSLSPFYNSQGILPMQLCELSKLISGKTPIHHRRSQTHFVELFYACHSSLPPESHITNLMHLPNNLRVPSLDIKKSCFYLSQMHFLHTSEGHPYISQFVQIRFLCKPVLLIKLLCKCTINTSQSIYWWEKVLNIYFIEPFWLSTEAFPINYKYWTLTWAWH